MNIDKRFQGVNREIEINELESRYEGDIDLRGFLGISEDVPVAYQDIRVYFKIDADISDEQKEELIQMAQKIFAGFQYDNKISSGFSSFRR